MKYRNKPVVVEAMKFTVTDLPLIELWFKRYGVVKYEFELFKGQSPRISLPTLEGTKSANLGDYIVRGTHGEFYSCNPEPFLDTFSLVELECPICFGEHTEDECGRVPCRCGWRHGSREAHGTGLPLESIGRPLVEWAN